MISLVRVFIIFNLIVTIAISSSCDVKEKIEMHEKARENADFIMENLEQQTITNQFPEKYFPRQQFKPFLDTLIKNCDFKSKKGKCVDFFSITNNGKNQTAFIYEYILRCDSLRFIYMYDLEFSEPELFKLRIEGLEQANEMILDPTKQLLYSGAK
jgi:hypothetical protein